MNIKKTNLQNMLCFLGPGCLVTVGYDVTTQEKAGTP